MIEDNSRKIDIFLSNSVSKGKKMYLRYLIYHLLKVILLSIFMGVYYEKNQKNESFNSFIFAIVVGGCYVLLYMIVLGKLYDSQKIFMIGELIEHVGKQPNVGPIAIQDRLNSNVASVYDFSNPTFQYTDEQKQQMQSSLGQIVGSTIIQEDCITRSSFSILNMCSIALIIYFIYALAQYPSDAVLKGVCITYIVLQAFSKYEVIIVLILVALSPLILVILCCVCCCCHPQQQQYNMPEIEILQFSPVLNLEQTQCRICFQNFSIGDKVQVLPCDKKHVFHQFCIGSWFKVSNTCPMCRRNIAELGAQKNNVQSQNVFPV